MKTNILYFGIKEDGVALRIINANLLKQECDNLPKGRYSIKIEKYRKNKSNQQLGYLFAGVYPLVLKGLNDAGWEFTSIAEVDEYCKSMFAEKEVLNRNTGEIMKIPGLKRNFNTVEMMTYVDSIRNWASEYLNIFIPEPSEQIDINFEE
jgi:hypothetical protein